MDLCWKKMRLDHAISSAVTATKLPNYRYAASS